MFIGCTKKLQDEMKIKAQEAEDTNDLYSWSAHLIIVNRKKILVVVNDSNRFGFVISGLKAKDFKILDKLILNGIRKCLKNEWIKEEIIEQYLNETGAICFSKTKGSKYVSRLNKACEVVKFFPELIDLQSSYQFSITNIMNSDLVKIDKQDYEHPYELFLRDFKKAYGESIIKCKAVNLLIKLDVGVYIAQRKVITPVDTTFKQLHEIIQSVFEWKNCHSHDFNVFDKRGKCILNVITNLDDVLELRQDCETAVESEVFVSDYIKGEFKIIYCYDFGDNWQHEITMQQVSIDYDKNYPVCLEGVGNAPPEDIGGVPGYEEFFKVISDPTHPAYAEAKDFAIEKSYKKFDIDLVNRELRYSFKK